jgi:uncharacterized DUF497 family protein
MDLCEGAKKCPRPWDFVREAQEVFDDPNHVAAENYFVESEGEQRYQVIGMTRNLVRLLVVFVDRDTPGAETIHTLPARKAVDYETSIYQDQFR